MIRKGGCLLAALMLWLGSGWGANAAERRLLFTGDILLGREVAREIRLRGGVSPWHALRGLLGGADFVFGNFEGAVGAAEACSPDQGPCLVMMPDLLPLLKQAGFSAVGVANNHSADLGADGRAETRSALGALGVAALGSTDSPGFVRWGDWTVALISLDLIPGRDGVADTLPSPEVARRLRLARSLADWVVVSVHWGAELADWVGPGQRHQAEWLVDHGADLIVGHHPHVVQRPECVQGRPVFFSLGNHVFDQKYPATKEGLIADCTLGDAGLACRPLPTHTAADTSFPERAETAGRDREPPLPCTAPAGPGLTVAGWRIRPFGWPGRLSSGDIALEGRSSDGRHWETSARPLLSLDVGRLVTDGPPFLFTVERQSSSIDREDGPRPYVYQVSDHGLVARWRGSALAWPLLSARLIDDATGRAFVCARHRGDSFVLLKPDAASTERVRHAVYAWTGFGFAGVTREDLTARCASLEPE